LVEWGIFDGREGMNYDILRYEYMEMENRGVRRLLIKGEKCMD
jgi:hypothetical protein